MATVTSVALTQPSADPNIDETQTFTIGGQITKANHGGLDYNMVFQWDQGTGTWVDIPTTGAALTIDAQPAANIIDEVEHTATITGNTAGSYNVRVQTTDNNDTGALDTSGTQAVTVNVNANVNVTTNLRTMTLTEQAATVALDVNVSTNLDTLALTTYAATVSTTSNTEVTTNLASMTLTEQQATVTLDVNVNAALATMTLTANPATITLDRNVQASAASMTLTENPATIAFGKNVLANTASLTLTEHAAGVALDVDIPAAAAAMTLTTYPASIASGTKTVVCTLVTRTGVPLEQTNLSWSWFDAVDPASFGAPTDQGGVEASTSTGELSINVPGSSLTSGQTGTLVLRSDDGVLFGAYNLDIV